MQEKELRLAIVYFGGVSLAIYQHGVNVEILNLLRASKAFHAHQNFARRHASDRLYTAEGGTDRPDDPVSTEAVYFDLLKEIGKLVDLRIMVDVVSGSSAGGINAAVMARAIAHDLSIAPLTAMWFEKADILDLITPAARAGKWSKWYVAPIMKAVFARMAREGVLPRDASRDIRRRLSTFVRSRWFKPPFDGPYFCGLLLDGMIAMERGAPTGSTLLPPETRLDLRISVTDFYGAGKLIFMHDPAVVLEREHRQVLQFAAVRPSSGLLQSEFDTDNVPSLAFAARASASYPGAFPPAQIREMAALVARRGMDWPGKEQFLARNFSHYRQIGLEPEDAVLLDGSILNNKPVRAAIDALRSHAAYREVDRRLIFIDPHPEHATDASGLQIPGFFTTLRRALSDLPRHEPIYEELEETNRFNEQVASLKSLARSSRRNVLALIERATHGGLTGTFTAAQVLHWRLTSSNLLTSSSLTYNAWMGSLVREAIELISDLVCRTCDLDRRSQHARWVRDVIESWCEAAGMFPGDYVIPDTVTVNAELPPFAQFVVNFGVRYKARRIAHVLNEINATYQLDAEAFSPPLNFDLVDELKRQVGNSLRGLYVFETPQFLQKLPAATIRDLFCPAESGPRPHPVQFVRLRRTELTDLFATIGTICGLAGISGDLDELLSSPLVMSLHPKLREAVLSGYLGWPYSDIVLLPAINALGFNGNALEEVLIDRISPKDARSVCIGPDCAPLRGEAAIGFGGFLDRASRQNDYLWGRIHAIDRLIDIVASTFDPSGDAGLPDFAAFKKSALECMLLQEGDRLADIPDVVDAVRSAVAKL